MELIIGPRH